MSPRRSRRVYGREYCSSMCGYVELVLKWPNLVPDRVGSLKRGNIIDTIRRFLVNFAILAFSLPENDLRQPLYLVVSKSMNNFSLRRSPISKKRILGTGPKLKLCTRSLDESKGPY